MPDRLFFPLLAAAAIALIALSLVWPRGMSAPAAKGEPAAATAGLR